MVSTTAIPFDLYVSQLLSKRFIVNESPLEKRRLILKRSPKKSASKKKVSSLEVNVFNYYKWLLRWEDGNLFYRYFSNLTRLTQAMNFSRAGVEIKRVLKDKCYH